MKKLVFIGVFMLAFAKVETYGQDLVPNFCDSLILNGYELEQCRLDSVWKMDLIPRINYVSELKTYLLPKYRKIRQEQVLPRELEDSLQKLRLRYDSVLNHKTWVFLSGVDRNNLYLRPKAYLSSLLALEVFKFYPDVHAILLNTVHVDLEPKTTLKEWKEYAKMVDNVLKLIPSALYQRLEAVTTDLNEENELLRSKGFVLMFQGAISDEERAKYRVVDFLLWTK